MVARGAEFVIEDTSGHNLEAADGGRAGRCAGREHTVVHPIGAANGTRIAESTATSDLLICEAPTIDPVTEMASE